MLGMNDPAGMMISFAQAINRYTEHTARVVSYRSMYAHDYSYDLEVPRLGDDWDEIEMLLAESDIFHFHMLLDETYQLGPFQIGDFCEGKGLLYHHHGTYDHQCFLGQQALYRERYARTGKRAIVSTPDLLQYLPMASWQPNIIPIHDPAFLPRADQLTDQAKFKVVQAPTRKWYKNTEEFVPVCDELALQLDHFQYEVLSGFSFRECLARKRDAQASFDHMQGWFGIASLESLSHGLPTLAGLTDDVIDHIEGFTGSRGVPWRVVRNKEELHAELLTLYRDRDFAKEVGKSSRAFMEKYWTEQQVLAPLLGTYQAL